jgi:hypothetical protein
MLELQVGEYYLTRRGYLGLVIRRLKTIDAHAYLVILKDFEGVESAETYTEHGKYLSTPQGSSLDLVAVANIPTKK